MESIYRLVRHQEKMVLAMQLVISIAFLLVGLTIPMNNFFVISLALGRGFASASNDVASDGFYMLALEKEQQSFS
jgi:PAT family beta-lactamase induction signal transducer AmpG